MTPKTQKRKILPLNATINITEERTSAHIRRALDALAIKNPERGWDMETAHIAFSGYEKNYSIGDKSAKAAILEEIARYTAEDKSIIATAPAISVPLTFVMVNGKYELSISGFNKFTLGDEFKDKDIFGWRVFPRVISSLRIRPNLPPNPFIVYQHRNNTVTVRADSPRAVLRAVQSVGKRLAKYHTDIGMTKLSSFVTHIPVYSLLRSALAAATVGDKRSIFFALAKATNLAPAVVKYWLVHRPS